MKFIINRKTFISMLFIGLTLLGIVSYSNLPVELYPNAELPFLIIQIRPQLEVDPYYMENQAIIPLEGAAGTLEGIENIESFADPNRGMIIIYYTKDTDIKYAYLKLSEKIDLVKNNLPEEFNVMVLKVDTEQLTNQFMSLQIRGGGGVDRVRNVADEEIVPKLENIDGISNVELFGGREKSVEILLDKEKLDALNLTAFRVRSLIAQNGMPKTFVGRIDNNGRKMFVNVTSEFNDIDDLKNIVVSENGPVLLGDIADITFGVKEETSLSRINGKEAVTMQLVRESQSNLISLSHKVIDTIDELNEELSYLDIEISVQTNSAEEIEKNIDLIIQLALIGGLLAVIILWIFLKNLKLVITIALAIPISVMTAFNLFYYFDISINSLTLIGMALAIGMLLDNSIVVLENIYRLASKNYDNVTSVTQGTKEVWRSIFAATLTTVTVFLPFIFSTNYLIELLGYQIGVSIISTLVVSLFVALLLIPMLTHYFLERKTGRNNLIFQKFSGNNRLVRIYVLLLKFSIRHPARTIVGAVVVFFASVFISLALSLNVTEEVQTSELNLFVTMSQGSTLESTDQAVSDIEERIGDLEEIKDVISQIYQEDATLKILLKDDFESIDGRTIEQIKSEIYNRVRRSSASEVSFEQPQSSQRYRGASGGNSGTMFMRMLGIGSQTEKIVIKGQDFETMRKFAEDVSYYLEGLSSIQNVGMNVSENRPELHILFDKNLMSDYDIPLGNVASELTTTQNEFSAGVTFKQDNKDYDITIKTDTADVRREKTIYDLRHLPVSSNSGSIHELQSFSDFVFSSGLSSINRVNQEKEIDINYQFLAEINDSKTLLEDARGEVDDLIATLNVPAGLAVEVVHDETDLQDFYFLIGAAFILIYMILASVFESFATPVVLMFSIPLAAIGSFWALILTDNSLLNANTLTGFLILLGIVVNNGIILIDYARILRKRGFSRSRALITAGLARVRPILITAITTIVAMMPLAMGQAEYVSVIGAPFAITVVGGLAVSTLFTLIFIPTFQSGLENALAWIRKLDWRIKTIQLIIFAGGSLLIYFDVDSFIWQLADLFLLVLVIPALTYFIIISLRQAKTKLIGKDEAITIRIRNLMKIYDQDSKFVSEWKRSKNVKSDAKAEQKAGVKIADKFLWQLPLLGYLIYFAYFYLENSFWEIFFAVITYFYFMYLWSSASQLLNKYLKLSAGLLLKIGKIILWFYPLASMIFFYFKHQTVSTTLLFIIIWYCAIIVYTTSNRLHHEKININRLTGKFTRIRRSFYQIVKSIPIIGKKKVPFKALNGVSIDIKSGMFGLLGPNGAGKTTLMRMICGILNQSYGKIYINGIDTNEKREELQGLIGYLPQEFGMYENMTAEEFLNYQAILKNLIDNEKREKMVRYVLESVHMIDHKDEKISSFSGGMKQRIGIAQILLHLPKILVVDEPTAGLDPRERIRFRNLLVELSRERVVVFSTHIIEDVSSSCNTVAVLNRGELRYLGEPVKMTKIAEGKVWHFYVQATDFEKIKNDFTIIHHMRDGDRIRIRCLSSKKPDEEAESVQPTLEDAYLWIQSGKEIA